ncbi:MAG: thiamine pyrophosphate-dependent enzyme [Eubacteriales bacterium]|nr:2-oxoglutarate synthase [Bacillota bacterium]MBV1727987.1 2-oxoglutarate synthase [Desulforudis sp.]MDP3049772.1 thiamine pyrophosphate-dependent enzyme [Eubacteriales bacterium]MDQ7789908.1 thiamine pyrophosphate-dependent enzyme [Clostridia bacterium]MBU4532972.1 2-oxoglutarate synthase [Bacillota bacterium]
MAVQPAMPRSWRRETKPHKFCPGCGHGIALRVLGQAIDQLNIQDRMVFGCDIGCSLLAWDFFNVDTVQTHHGRTTPVIVGLKRARPELVCVAYMGDGGGYAIGAQHLVSAAMRNDRITVILINNTQYAMTGGQMAPTTLPGQKTETSPYGRDPDMTGHPTQGPEMVATITPESAYVARGTISRPKQLHKMVTRALENQIAGRGFSFVEILATCPTNWRTNAKNTWKFIEETMPTHFKVGELKVPEAFQAAAGGEGARADG